MPREWLHDLNIHNGMQALAQTDKQTHTCIDFISQETRKNQRLNYNQCRQTVCDFVWINKFLFFFYNKSAQTVNKKPHTLNILACRDSCSNTWRGFLIPKECTELEGMDFYTDQLPAPAYGFGSGFFYSFRQNKCLSISVFLFCF